MFLDLWPNFHFALFWKMFKHPCSNCIKIKRKKNDKIGVHISGRKMFWLLIWDHSTIQSSLPSSSNWFSCSSLPWLWLMALVSKRTLWWFNWTILEKMTRNKEQLVLLLLLLWLWFLDSSFCHLDLYPFWTKQSYIADIFPQNKGSIWIVPWFWNMVLNFGPSCSLFFTTLPYFLNWTTGPLPFVWHKIP